MPASSASFDIPGFREPSPVDTGPGFVVVHALNDRQDRAVAITVHDPPLDGAAQSRFLRDGEAARRLGAHPHAVTVHETGILPDGRAFVVTDRYEGGRLDMRVERRGPLPVSDALRVGIALAGVLETAHRAGVLHRGLSPGRVLLAKDGRPVLADLGLSWLTEREGVATLLGLTPYHAPPEVLEKTDATPASDVYSLASTLYALLAGLAPHETPGGGDTIASLLLRVLHQRVPPLGRPDVPDTLDRVLRTALACDPGARQQRALFFAQQLQAIQHELGTDVTEPAVLDLGDMSGLETPARQVFVPAPQFLDGLPLAPTPPPSVTDPPSAGSSARSNGHRSGAPDPSSALAPCDDASDKGAAGVDAGTAVAVADREPTDGGTGTTTITYSPFWTEPLRQPQRAPTNRARRRGDRGRPRLRPPESIQAQAVTVTVVGASTESAVPATQAEPGPATRSVATATEVDAPTGPRRADHADPARSRRRSPAHPPAMPVLVLLVIVVVLALGAIWLVATGEDVAPARSSTGGATAGTEARLVPGGLTAVEGDSDVQLDWEGPTDARYIVMVMSETAPPRTLTTSSGSALLIATADLRPGEAYCFAVAHSDAVAAAPTGRADEVFGSPECIRGASPATMRRGP